jgi:sterol desaturase/sphingolipid hydroxylase (fatty acid hydroxylase superfamily)
MHFEPIKNQKEPIRLFKSDFLEFFTHIHPVFVLAVWVPIVVFCLYQSILAGMQLGQLIWLPGILLAGLILWTFSEYVLHRFVFHFPPRNAWQTRIAFLFHGIHHAQPQSKTRLVMPPIVSIPMAGVFFLLFRLIFGFSGQQADFFVFGLFAAFIIGYLFYDMIHYITHHFTLRAQWLKNLKLYHMQHHYKTPDQRYGVSSPFWDVIFHTKPE